MQGHGLGGRVRIVRLEEIVQGLHMPDARVFHFLACNLFDGAQRDAGLGSNLGAAISPFPELDDDELMHVHGVILDPFKGFVNPY